MDRETRMNDNAGSADELPRGTTGPETNNSRRDNRMNDSANELVPRGMVRRETNNYCSANRINDTIV